MQRYGSLFLSLSICLPLILSAQDSARVRAHALDRFDAYTPKIEASQGMQVKYRKAVVGYLNEDDMLDAAVEFGLGPEKSSKAVERQIAVYIDRGEELEAVAGIEPSYCPKLLRIHQQKLAVLKLSSCIQPLPKGKLHYIWNGEEMVLKE